MTAASEAMTFSYACLSSSRQKAPNKIFLVSDKLFPQTIQGLSGRAEGFGIKVVVTDLKTHKLDAEENLIGAMVQYPDVDGKAVDWLRGFSENVHAKGGIVCCATDLLALTVLKPPGEWGADVVFGNAQRFGVPLGFGGPHAAFFATKETHKRKLPGRLVGASKDRLGNRAYRLALQTREQHIRREKATSNICTAQALLANMSAMYAVYHGPHGLKQIAHKIIAMRRTFVENLIKAGFPASKIEEGDFDTVVINFDGQDELKKIVSGPSYRHHNPPMVWTRQDEKSISVSFDETHNHRDIIYLTQYLTRPASEDTADKDIFPPKQKSGVVQIVKQLEESGNLTLIPEAIRRTSPFLDHPVFNTHHSETEMLRYIHHLQSRDLSLAHTMIPLGSCTMKLNGTVEMLPLSMPGFADLHPFGPPKLASGYLEIARELEEYLSQITGFAATSLQPNSGAQGEFTGLRVIRQYFKAAGQDHRDTILIPVSAHGTNPASAAMVGYKVVSVKCDAKTGNLDIEDLRAKAEKHKDNLAGIMVTYPSTYGVSFKLYCQGELHIDKP